MLPPIASAEPALRLIQRSRSSTPCECPCAVSTTGTSPPASTSAATRSSVPSPTPTAAPTRSLPGACLHALGCSLSFRMSLTVTRPIRWNSSSITSTRSSRCRCMSALASSRLAPSRTVTSFLCGVMMDFTGWSSSASKRRWRLVTMPTTLPLFTTGKPEILYCCCSAITSRTVISGEMVIGSRSTPDSKRLTLATSTACAWGVRFLWMMPMPPSWAMAMASRASVTVSMAADTRGMFSSSLRVRRVFRETSRGRTREWAGRRRTSSKVSAFWITRMSDSRKAALYCHPCLGLSVDTSMTKALLCAVGLAFAATALAQQYRWVDKDGKVGYGDTPPPGVQATSLKPPPAGAPAPTTAPQANPEAAFRKRQQERQEKEEKSAKERADAETKRVNCEQSQASLRTLQSGQRISSTNAAGERVFIDDEERTKEIERTQRAVNDWCK